MPIFDFVCNKCGNEFEQFLKVNSDTVVVCGECGSPEVNRTVSSSNFILSGGGWAKDNYATT